MAGLNYSGVKSASVWQSEQPAKQVPRPSNAVYNVLAAHAMRLQHERDARQKALTLIADDCEAWLAGESDEPSMEFIKLVAKYAREAASA
jgi:hypothetical protein